MISRKIITLFAAIFVWNPIAHAAYDMDFKGMMGFKYAEPFATDAVDYALSDILDGDKLVYSALDLNIRGKGRGASLDLSFSRRYNSILNSNSTCGYSWFTNLDTSLQILSSGTQAVLQDEKGDLITFSATYVYPIGFQWIAQSKPNPHRFYQNGTTFIFQKKYGNKYIFDTTTKLLLKIQDQNGNEIIYNRNAQSQVTSLQDSSGRQIIFTYNAQGKLVTAKDPLNRIYTYSYDTNQNLISVTDPLGNVTAFEYQFPLDIHNVTRITKPAGNYQSFEYNSTDKLTRILQNGNETWNMIHNQSLASMISNNTAGLQVTRQFFDSGKKVTITDNFGTETNELDDWGYLKKYTDKLGRITTMNRDSRANVLSMTNARGNTTTQTFNGGNKTSQMFSPLNVTETFVYDSKWNLIQYANPEGGVCTLTYDASGLPLTFKDANNKTTSLEYDVYGNLKKITNPTGGIQEFTFDLIGNILTAKDGNGNVTSFVYDLLNRRTQITNPDNTTKVFTFDSNGNTLTETDENANTTAYAYNFLDKVETLTDAEGSAHHFTYDAMGRKISHTDPNGFVYQYEYDARDRLTKEIYPDGAFTRYEYAAQSLSKMSDAEGLKPIRITDPIGNTSQVEYNELYARTKNIDPLGNQKFKVWDAKDRIIEERDENSNPIKYTFNKMGKVTSIENALTFKKNITYDYAGNTLTLKDEENHIESYQYDGLNRIVAKINALGKTTSYTFDYNSNPLSIIDSKGNPISWQYDSRNRKIKEIDAQNHQTQYFYDGVGNLIQVIRPDGTQFFLEYFKNNVLKKTTYPGNQTVTFAYDFNKNMTSLTDWNGTEAFSYDNRNRLIQVTRTDGKKIKYSYNANGMRTLLTLLDSIGTELYRIAYTLDALGRVTHIQDGTGHSVSFVYDSSGRKTTKTFSNGVATSYLYDVANRLTQQKSVNSSQTILSQTDFTCDKTGNLRMETSESGLVKTYGYDAIYQLLSVNYNNGQSTIWTYDNTGNRLSQSENGILTNYTYNNLNQLTQSNANGGTAYSYDFNGNLIQSTSPQQTTQYGYNFLNKAVSVTKTGTENSFLSMLHDGLGRRISKTYSTGESVSYLYDGQNILEEISSSTLSYYMTGGIDELFTKTSNGQTDFYLTDSLNSLRKVTDQNQNVSATLDYKPFGSLLSGAPGNQHYLFTGREKDFDDAYYYRARTYSPITGRFQQKDPIGVAGGDINFYRYVNNQPLVGADPLGLKIYYMWRGLHVDVRIEGKDTHRYDGQWGFAPDGSSVSEELWQMFLGGFTWVPGMISYNSGGMQSLAINNDYSDARVYQNIMSSISNPPMYNIIYYDCWDWASDMVGG